MGRRTSSEWIGQIDRDAQALRDLAQLNGVCPLVGEILVAEVAGELRAARTLGDPFRRTVDICELLEVHARHLNGTGVRPARRLRRLVPGLRRLRTAL